MEQDNGNHGKTNQVGDGNVTLIRIGLPRSDPD